MKREVRIIKLDKKVNVIAKEDRLVCELIIGKYYYVVFYNQVYLCKLIEILKNGKIRIEKYPSSDFNLQHGKKLKIKYNVLYPDEIGTTPLQAMQHR